MPNEDLGNASKKEQRRKAKKKRRKAEISALMTEIKKLKKTVRQMSKDRQQDREAAEQDRQAAEQEQKLVDQRFDEQNSVNRQFAEDLHHSNLLHKTTVDSTVLPIITAIIYKVMYRVGFGNPRVEPRPGKDHKSILLSHLERFARFGLHSEEEMESFANSVSNEHT